MTGHNGPPGTSVSGFVGRRPNTFGAIRRRASRRPTARRGQTHSSMPPLLPKVVRDTGSAPDRWCHQDLIERQICTVRCCPATAGVSMECPTTTGVWADPPRRSRSGPCPSWPSWVCSWAPGQPRSREVRWPRRCRALPFVTHLRTSQDAQTDSTDQ